jgi:hypothetical protein
MREKSERFLHRLRNLSIEQDIHVKRPSWNSFAMVGLEESILYPLYCLYDGRFALDALIR